MHKEDPMQNKKTETPTVVMFDILSNIYHHIKHKNKPPALARSEI